MDKIFHRTVLAQQMAQQLLHPGVFDEGLRSGLFISGARRTGKTTFLQADLWSNMQANPAALVHGAIRKALGDLQSPASTMASRLKNLSSAETAVAGFKFGFKVESAGTDGRPTLAEAFTQVVDQA